MTAYELAQLWQAWLDAKESAMDLPNWPRMAQSVLPRRVKE